MLWMLFLTQSVFAADVISVDARCATAPKSFRISDQKSQFQEVSVINGQKIRIKSRSPNEDVLIDCRELMTPAKAGETWTGVQQELKLGFWDVIPGVLLAKVSKSEITLTNKNDFPAFSKIVVQQSRKKTEVTLQQSPWKGDDIRIQCPASERLGEDSIRVTVFKAGKATGFYTLEDREAGKPILPDGPAKVACGEERYSVSLKEGRLQNASSDQSTPAGSGNQEIVK